MWKVSKLISIVSGYRDGLLVMGNALWYGGVLRVERMDDGR
jgi:hypothetical protein